MAAEGPGGRPKPQFASNFRTPLVRLDPEDLREVITAVAYDVARLDGLIAGYMCDGILVYFR